MPNQTQLNPDAVRAALTWFAEAVGEVEVKHADDGTRPGDYWNGYRAAKNEITELLAEPKLIEKATRVGLAVAQSVVNSVDYLATPRGHYDAWTDTGDGYTQRKGWTLTCLWCGAEFTGATKGEALKGYEAHEEKILQLLRVEDAERAKNRPVVPGA